MAGSADVGDSSLVPNQVGSCLVGCHENPLTDLFPQNLQLETIQNQTMIRELPLKVFPGYNSQARNVIDKNYGCLHA